MQGSFSINIAKKDKDSKKLSVQVISRLENVSFVDKCLLVRFLCNSIDLEPDELVICAALMESGKLKADSEIMIDVDPIIKAKENLSNE